MRNILILLVVALALTNVEAQNSKKLFAKFETSSEETTLKGSFAPNDKLLIQEIWKRVDEYRFECEFLRLAVEYRNQEYLLIEMDGNHRILARDVHYSVISDRILELTLKNSI